VSTTDHVTVNYNQIPGATYLDVALAYRFRNQATDGYGLEAFLNIQNIANSDPPPVTHGPAGVAWALTTANPTLYDTMGRRFHAGIRFKM
jgi:outer membrane receptor protein involved in Fe transport